MALADQGEPTTRSLAADEPSPIIGALGHMMILFERGMRQDMTQGVSLAQLRFDPQPSRKPDVQQSVPPSRHFGRKRTSASGSREMCGVDDSDRDLSTAS